MLTVDSDDESVGSGFTAEDAVASNIPVTKETSTIEAEAAKEAESTTKVRGHAILNE
jgi:hypothetical protein